MLHPQQYCEPLLHMGPFDTASFEANAALLRDGAGRELDWVRALGRDGTYTLTTNAREALALALEALGLVRDDVVLILTSSGSPYVSHCVTDEIEKLCRWTRDASAGCVAIMVVHEFGYPCTIPPELRARGVPIIEDCAYALGSGSDAGGPVGRIGDWVAYSFSKAFPLQYGGLLRAPRAPGRASRLSALGADQLRACLAHYVPRLDAALAARRRNFAAYQAAFAAHGLASRFAVDAATVPHAFVVAMSDQALAERIKPRLNRAGIESSVFYGGGGYFLPCHQGMDAATVEYIVANVAAAVRDGG